LLNYSGLQDKDISILFVDNHRIQILNKRFFKKDNPTNVISFSYMNGLPCEVVGDIAISLEKAKEEARISSTPLTERVFTLIIHGILHIIGFDHEKGKREERKMKYREKRLLTLVKSHRLYNENLIR